MKNVNIERVYKAIQTICDCELKIKKQIKTINSFFNYQGFDEYNDLYPEVSICSGYEINIVCNGYELDLESALKIQESKGYIEPDDIPGLKL